MARFLFRRPMTSVGPFVLDCELGESRGSTRDVTQRRLPRGAIISDHSILNPGGKRYSLIGRVSDLPQPQNVGRLSPTAIGPSLESLFQDTIAGALGISTRRADAESLLESTIAEGEEVTVVCAKAGKFQAIVLSWQASDGDSDHYASTYAIELLQIQRAVGLFFTDPTEEAEALNGTGAASDLGPTSATTEVVDFTP